MYKYRFMHKGYHINRINGKVLKYAKTNKKNIISKWHVINMINKIST